MSSTTSSENLPWQEQWHDLGTPQAQAQGHVFLALRTARPLKDKRYLRHILRAYFTSSDSASAATQAATNVSRGYIPVQDPVFEKHLLMLASTPAGSEEIARLTVLCDELVRFLDSPSLQESLSGVRFDDIEKSFHHVFMHKAHAQMELLGFSMRENPPASIIMMYWAYRGAMEMSMTEEGIITPNRDFFVSVTPPIAAFIEFAHLRNP